MSEANTSDETSIVWRRVNPSMDIVSPGSDEIFTDFDCLANIARDLSIRSELIEEMLFEQTAFGIWEDSTWAIPRRQFSHVDGSFRLDERPQQLFKGLDTLVPHLSKSRWVLWKILFAGSVKPSRTEMCSPYRLARDDMVCRLIDDPSDTPTALAYTRERIAKEERFWRKMSPDAMEALLGVCVVPED